MEPKPMSPVDAVAIATALTNLESHLEDAVLYLSYLTIGRQHGGFRIPCLDDHLKRVVEARTHVTSLRALTGRAQAQ